MQPWAPIMMRFIPLFFIFILFPLSVSAQPEGIVSEPVTVRLLSAYEGVGTFATHDMGLELSIQDQWYTYWRMPGETGLAPVMDWSKSANVKNVEVGWPAPKRFKSLDFYSFGYQGLTVLPLKVTPEKSGEDITLNLKLDLVVCHEICIPQTIKLEKTISGKKTVKSPDFMLVQNAIRNIPAQENTRKLSMDTAILGKNSIVITAASDEGFDHTTEMFIESADIVLSALPEITPQDKAAKQAVIKIAAPEDQDITKALFGKKITVTLVNKGQALERTFSF